MLARYLTGDPPDPADRSAQVTRRRNRPAHTDVALVETACVLTAVYEIVREEVVDHLIGLLRKENIHPFRPPF